MPYAQGRRAIGICDRCGRQVMRHGMVQDIFNQTWTGFLVCDDCNDIDNEQLPRSANQYLQKIEADAIWQPRSDSAEEPFSSAFIGWNPVAAFGIRVNLGNVKVII